MKRSSAAFSVILALACGGSCYSGLAADGDGSGDATVDTAATATTAGDTGDTGDTGDEPPAAPEVPAPTLRRLTTAEFSHSVRDLLGDVTIEQVEIDSLKSGFFSVGNATVAVSPAGVGLYEKALDLATSQAFSDPVRAATVVSCVPTDLADLACFRDALAGFARRAWRRPLTAPELDRYLTIATAVAAETGDSVAGLRHAAWGLLESPNFLYRVEIGEPVLPTEPVDPAAPPTLRRRYTSYEMASRLSYTLWSTTPDELLLDAAERDELITAEGVLAQAQRLLADPRARQGVENFVSELYSLWTLPDTLKDSQAFPDWTTSLRAAMRDDLLARFTDIVFTAPGDFFSLYDSDKVFVNNELARLYGLPETDPDSLRAAQLPADGLRRGLIASAGVLAMNSLPARTSATKRGHFISDALLCRPVPPPPPNVDLDIDKDQEEVGPQTLREKLERHRADPACAGCHALTDPMGLALENFDTIGKFRPDDQGLVIDASGELDGVPFANGNELAVLLRDHPEAPRCLVRKLYTYVTGRLPASAEQEILAGLQDGLSNAGNRFDLLLLALVTRDEFRFVNPPGSTLAPDEGEMP